MNSDNAYAPPETDVISANQDGSEALKHLSTDMVKKLYNYSRNVGALTFLWCLSIAGSIAILLGTSMLRAGAEGEARFNNFFLGIIFVTMLITIAAVYGSWTRKAWARGLGIVLCVLMLMNFPLGTIIGIFGIISLSKGARLFGPDRITHKQLKAEVAARKSHKR